QHAGVQISLHRRPDRFHRFIPEDFAGARRPRQSALNAQNRRPLSMTCIHVVSRVATAAALLAGVAVQGHAFAADPSVLTGIIKSPAGEPMGGVTVSAKAVGSTITTTVFTDESGNYYFPALP